MNAKNYESEFTQEIEKLDKKRNSFKIITTFLVIALILVSILLFDGINYYDPVKMCFLSIRSDPFNGENGKVIKAVKLIKSDDENKYYKLCQKVRYIWERNCIKPKDLTRSEYVYTNTGGCYFKGSDVIFIETKSKNDSINKIAEQIKYSLDLID